MLGQQGASRSRCDSLLAFNLAISRAHAAPEMPSIASPMISPCLFFKQSIAVGAICSARRNHANSWELRRVRRQFCSIDPSGTSIAVKCLVFLLAFPLRALALVGRQNWSGSPFEYPCAPARMGAEEVSLGCAGRIDLSLLRRRLPSAIRRSKWKGRTCAWCRIRRSQPWWHLRQRCTAGTDRSHTGSPSLPTASPKST